MKKICSTEISKRDKKDPIKQKQKDEYNDEQLKANKKLDEFKEKGKGKYNDRILTDNIIMPKLN